MDIKLKKEENGLFTEKDGINFSKGGTAMVSVECSSQGYDEVFLKKEAESYLNQQALTHGMKVEEASGPLCCKPNNWFIF